MLHRGALLATAILTLLCGAPAAAQPGVVRLRSDNDAYRFWVPMDVRLDQEYSNGVHVEVERPGARGWSGLAPGVAPCGGDRPRCTTTTLFLGQKIYTPRVDSAGWVPGQRPYAGWLYAGVAGAVASPRVRRAAAVEVGVTGGPSAAAWVHTTLHRVFGFWEPQGWDEQIPFEPGLVVRYDERHLAGEVRAGGTRVAEVTASWGASAGNIRTEARGGVAARAGYRLPPPWNADRERGLSLYATGALQGRGVAHDLFLDGSTLGGGPRVERIPWVGEWQAGLGAAYRGVTVEYRVTTRSREYRTEPGMHQYATFDLALRRAF